MKRDSHGDRMKYYESLETDKRLMKGIPIYGRLDGKSFSKFTKVFKYPYDAKFREVFDNVSKFLVEEFNVDLVYHQSDEISFCWLSDPEDNKEIIFGGKVQKIVSVLAAKVSSRFVIEALEMFPEHKEHIIKNTPAFDCRVFNVPNLSELANEFVWREKDCTRNSLSMLASSMYSHKQLMGKSSADKHDMIHTKGDNWNNWPVAFKRGHYLRKENYKLDENDPDSPIRSKVVVVEHPPITKVRNKVGVLFYKEKPEMME